MPGAVYQLNLRGMQDKYLTGNPEFNFIKQVYKRHANFAIEQKELLFNTIVDFDKHINIEIKRNADFLHKLYFKFELPPLVPTSGTYAGWTNSVGHVIINYIDLFIGGHLIDRHYGLFLEIWFELTTLVSVNLNTDSLIGKSEQLDLLQTNALTQTRYCVPLRFWFCSDISLALPLINLMYHKVELKINLNKFENCIVYDGNTPPNNVIIQNPSILTEYIYIDDSERIKYINSEQTYLITQIQNQDMESIESQNVYKSKLDFNHPVSELLFVLREQESEANNDYYNFAQRNIVPFTSVVPLLKSAKLVLDGQDRNDYMDEYVLRTVNSNRFHTNTTNKHIYSMSFCNFPEKLYPTGSLNFSLIDAAELHLNLESNTNPCNLFVFARNWNLIKIKNGMFKMGFNS